MRNINEMIGIIKGINFDGIINDMEIERLQKWLDNNRNLSYDKKQAEMINLVDKVLEDHVITEKEKNQLLNFADNYLNNNDDIACLYELNGIIEGIICDGVVNKKEIINLQKWLSENRNHVIGHKPSEDIMNLVNDILADGIVTDKEQKQLLELLNDRISNTQMLTKIDHIRKLVKNRNNIGLDLIDILDNENAIQFIHNEAEAQLKYALQSYSGILLTDSEIVFISLCLIGMLEYDGNFYDNVRKTYSNLYNNFSEQKIEGFIRTILSKFRSKDENKMVKSRKINVVLSNTIVPAHYLPAFFAFIYDIYKLNFEYDIPENLYEEFKFVYEGLRNNMLSDGDEIKIYVTKKSYKLIQTTKKLITNTTNLDSVINLSIIILKLIDKKVWGKEVKIFNPYLKFGFDEWSKTLNNEKRIYNKKIKKVELRSSWDVAIILKENSVYIAPPAHKVKSTYNYNDIKVVVKNGNDVIFINDNPYIKEIIGGYQIINNEIEIKNPLGKLRYFLMSGNEIIYDSKDKLFRNYIVFDYLGNELKNNTDYKGLAIICTTSNYINSKSFYNCENYDLKAINVSEDSSILIKNEIFSFSSMIKPGIFGEKLNNYYLIKNNVNLYFNVFSRVNCMVFESSNNTEKYEIIINGKPHKLSDFNFTRSKRDAYWRFVVDLEIDTSGIYTILINEIFNKKKTKIVSFIFGVDSKIICNENKIDDCNYIINIESSLCGKVQKNININAFSLDWLSFKYNGDIFNYFIPLQLNIYKIDNSPWKSMNDNLWINDIKIDSNLIIYGNEYDGIMVYSENGKVLQEELPLKNYKTHYKCSIGFLHSFKETNDYVLLVLLKKGKCVNCIRCYNRCVINKDLSSFHFDPVQQKLYVYPVFYGKGDVFFEIKNEKNEIVFSKKELQSNNQFVVDGLKSFINYRLSFIEKTKSLLLKNNKELFSFCSTFYSRDDFVGRYFKIEEVHYDQMIKGKFLRKSHYFNHVYVFFNKKISNDIFSGDIIIKTDNRTFGLSNINPVEIEICSEVENNEIELAITKDGDGLFLDFMHHGIMNTLQDDNAIDIFSYNININGVLNI